MRSHALCIVITNVLKYMFAYKPAAGKLRMYDWTDISSFGMVKSAMIPRELSCGRDIKNAMGVIPQMKM